MRQSCIICGLISVVITGCVKESYIENESNLIEQTFQVSSETTRTTLKSQGAVDFEAGDLIRYYSSDEAAERKTFVEQSGPKSNIRALIDKSDPYFVAVYGGGGLSNNGGAGFDLINAVPFVQNGLFESAHVAVAYSKYVNYPNLFFHNITSIFRVKVPESLPVDKLVFTSVNGEPLCGDARISLGDDIGGVFLPGGIDSITVNILNGAGSYYFSTLPGKISGLVIKAYIGDYLWGQREVRKDFTIKKNNIIALGNILDKKMGVTSDSGHPYYYSIINEDFNSTIKQKQIVRIDGQTVDVEYRAGVKYNIPEEIHINTKPSQMRINWRQEGGDQTTTWYDANDIGFKRKSRLFKIYIGEDAANPGSYLCYYDIPQNDGWAYFDPLWSKFSEVSERYISLREGESTDDLQVYDGIFHVGFKWRTENIIGINGFDYEPIVSTDIHCRLVYVPVKSIVMERSSLQIAKGQTVKLNYSVLPPSASQKCSLGTSDINVVSVNSSNGTITGVSTGEAIITVISESDNDYKATCTVTVTE